MSKTLKLNSYPLYDETCNRYYMVYEVEYDNGYKEYVSRDIFRNLKALEIIKEKNVDFKVLNSAFACEREKEIQCKIYNLNQWQWVYELKHPGCTNLNKDKLPRLTQEEFDLLKEVLL